MGFEYIHIIHTIIAWPRVYIYIYYSATVLLATRIITKEGWLQQGGPASLSFDLSVSSQLEKGTGFCPRLVSVRAIAQ